MISICIPTYSRLNYLQELIQCCLNQSYSDFEICISQDVTPNGLVQEIKSYCEGLVKQYPNIIKYQAQEKNIGLSGNWNALVTMAQGEYIFIPGDDDLISIDFLEKLLITTSKDADVLFSNQFFIDKNGDRLIDYTLELNNKYGRNNLKTGYLSEAIRNVLQSTIPMSAALIKREWFSKFMFDPKINAPELEVFLKIAINGGRFNYVNEQQAFYRVHETSATSSGLTIGQYLGNIIDIDVPDKYIEDKTALIQKAIIPGINNAIKTDNLKLAKKLINSGFYPSNYFSTKIIQKILLILPISISKYILEKRQ